MKRLNKILFIFLFSPLWVACSEDDTLTGDEEKGIKLEAFTIELGDRDALESVQTRATGDFVVNKAADPTHDDARLKTPGWKLDIQLYNNNAVYTPGKGTFTYSPVEKNWTSTDAVYFPNYLKTKVGALFYSNTWTPGVSAIDTDQSTNLKLLAQDVLVQSNNPNPYVIAPAHIPQITLMHNHSMIDFILTDVNFADIKTTDGVTVTVGGKTYTPYKTTATVPEYLVILPVGSARPVINIETKLGAKYSVELKTVTSTAINNCYCAKLSGVELLLTSVTVVDWTYGAALSGQYTTPSSYPTFRGTPGATITLQYINGLSQDITFNDRGEATVRPAGRTIIQIITKTGIKTLATPIILSQMYVDLTPYMQ